jgi:Ca2+-binding EF-hand superfamily protein
MPHTRTRAVVDSLRAAFDTFDADHNGRIDAGELRRALHALGVDVSASEVRKMLTLAPQGLRPDGDRARALDFDGFADLVDPQTEELEADVSPARAFALLDADGDGQIGLGELVAAGTSAWTATPALPADDAARLLHAATGDIDGHVGPETFAAWLAGDLRPPRRAP